MQTGSSLEMSLSEFTTLTNHRSGAGVVVFRSNSVVDTSWCILLCFCFFFSRDFFGGILGFFVGILIFKSLCIHGEGPQIKLQDRAI